MPETAVDRLTGTVQRITFFNPENGFTVLRLRVRGKRQPVAVAGTLPAVQPGETLILSGCWKTDPRHGVQFEPAVAEIARPSDVEGIIQYLGSGLIRLIGPILAKRIAATFGEQTLDVLDASPGRVREVPGIGRQRAEAIAAAWTEHRALRAITVFLSEHGLDTRFAPRLLRAYGPAAPRILAANPYRLVAEVPGLGFNAADRLGEAIGVRVTSPARLQAAVHATLLRAAERGHTRMLRADLAAEAAAAAKVEYELADAAIYQQLAAGVIAFRGEGVLASGRADASSALVAPGSAGVSPALVEELRQPEPEHTTSGAAADGSARPMSRLRVYEPTAPAVQAASDAIGIGLAGLVQAEEDLAARVRNLVTRRALPPRRVDEALEADEQASALSEEQRSAVRRAAVSGLFVLTGGPGVGKTTATRALVRILATLNRSVALAAPTGKAAKRLGDVVGVEAKTLHRLLGTDPKGFRYGPKEPLPFDAIIVDECSMLDTTLARALVRAVGPRAQLILVGDADQLPSVGPGQVLRDLLSAGRVPSVALNTVFRQAAQSKIVTNAHRIRAGLVPDLDGPAELANGTDCVFVPAAAGAVARIGADWAARLLPNLLGVPPSEVQALAPLNRVCQALNSTLQAQLNAPQGQAERPHGALPMRRGDRVIQTRNNYDLGVFNGDIGLLVEVEPDGAVVDFGDGRAVRYSGDELLDLEHAYCLTVHRAQGSEWPGVVVLASSNFGPMLSRNLLYTALTRARRAAVIVGDRAAIARAVADTRDQKRRTGLGVLLADA